MNKIIFKNLDKKYENSDIVRFKNKSNGTIFLVLLHKFKNTQDLLSLINRVINNTHNFGNLLVFKYKNKVGVYADLYATEEEYCVLEPR